MKAVDQYGRGDLCGFGGPSGLHEVHLYLWPQQSLQLQLGWQHDSGWLALLNSTDGGDALTSGGPMLPKHRTGVRRQRSATHSHSKSKKRRVLTSLPSRTRPFPR